MPEPKPATPTRRRPPPTNQPWPSPRRQCSARRRRRPTSPIRRRATCSTRSPRPRRRRPHPRSGAAPKKRKSSAADAADESPHQAQPPKKKKGKKAPPPPPEDDDDDDQDKQQDEPDNDPAPEIDPEVIEQAFKQYRQLHRKLPPADELAEALECDVAVAAGLIKKKKRAMEKTTNERRAAKVKGYYKGAVAAGYGDIKQSSVQERDFSMANARGTDSYKPLLSMSDVLRLATYVPPQPDQASYSPEEFKLRLELMDTTLPVDAARELLANADQVFRQIINRSTAVAMQQRSAHYVKPQHALAFLKPIAENMLFSSITAPAGLVAHAKGEEVLEATDVDAGRAATNAKHAKTNADAHKDKLKQIKDGKASAKAAREKAKTDAEALRARKAVASD